MTRVNKEFVDACKTRLIGEKTEILNKIKEFRSEIQNQKLSGDEIDQSTTVLIENQLLAQNQRLRFQLAEIERALYRIQLGQYGYCEETCEPIEEARLKVIPWTRLSAEGAEIRDSLKTQFA
jgi:DnaK suppressor protein